VTDDERARLCAESTQRFLAHLRETGRGLGGVTAEAHRELMRIDAFEKRVTERAVGIGTAAPTRPVFDRSVLHAFAAQAGVPLDEILAGPPLPRPGSRETEFQISRTASALMGAEVPIEIAEALRAGDVRDEAPLVDVRAWLARLIEEGRHLGKLLVLAGNPGTGKTFAACWGMVERIKLLRDEARRQAEELIVGRRNPEDVSGMYCTTEELVEPRGGAALADLASKADFLVLDEMGDETLTDVGLSRIHRVLGHRERYGLDTIGTSNLNAWAKRDALGRLQEPPQWADRFGRRLFDRLHQGGDFIGYAGASLRVPR